LQRNHIAGIYIIFGIRKLVSEHMADLAFVACSRSNSQQTS